MVKISHQHGIIVRFFKRQATLIAEHFKKGSEIVVIGKQENTKYEGKYYSNVIGLSF